MSVRSILRPTMRAIPLSSRLRLFSTLATSLRNFDNCQLGKFAPYKQSRNLSVNHRVKKQDSGSSLEELNFEQLYRIRSNIQHLIEDYSSFQIPTIDWAFIMQYKPPLQENEQYFLTIKTLNVLLTLTCHRLAALQALPYIAVVNPNIEQSNRLYLKTLESLLAIEYPYDLYNTEKIQTLTKEFLDDHQDTLLTLSNGLQEVSRFYEPERIFDFLNHHLHDRILMKLLATNYLKLIEQTSSEQIVGVVHKDLNIAELIRRTNEFVNDLTFVKYDKTVPLKIIEGEDLTLSYIPTDLEYVFQELLKNSSRAHIEGNVEKEIEVTIVKSDEHLEIRFRDFGGGIDPQIEDKIFDYSYSSTEQDAKDSGMSAYMIPGQDVHNVAGMGFGLPMCKSYLQLFNGSLDIQSLWGWGTDVYVKLEGPSSKLFSK